jgi:hypothetical protein
MKMNSELRTKKMIFRYRLKWVIFYLFTFVLLGLFSTAAYARLDNDNFGEGNIELILDKEKYQTGETIEFTIVNNFSNTIYIPNNCPEEPLNAYRWYTDRWIQIYGTANSKDNDCYTQPRRIAILPGEEITYHFEEWPDLFDSPGVYRIVVPVEHYDDLAFKDFVIMEPAFVVETDQPATEVTPAAPAPTLDTTQNENYTQNNNREDPLFEDDGRPRNEDGGDD